MKMVYLVYTRNEFVSRQRIHRFRRGTFARLLDIFVFSFPVDSPNRQCEYFARVRCAIVTAPVTTNNRFRSLQLSFAFFSIVSKKRREKRALSPVIAARRNACSARLYVTTGSYEKHSRADTHVCLYTSLVKIVARRHPKPARTRILDRFSRWRQDPVGTRP